MTKQEILDKVAKHLLTQNQQSRRIDEYGKSLCAYRNEEGLMCAAGCLVPEDQFSDIREGRSLSYQPFFRSFPVPEYNLVGELQYIHDTSPVDMWRKQLEGLALRESLAINF